MRRASPNSLCFKATAVQELHLGNKTTASLLPEPAQSLERAGQRGARQKRRERALPAGALSSCRGPELLLTLALRRLSGSGANPIA